MKVIICHEHGGQRQKSTPCRPITGRTPTRTCEELRQLLLGSDMIGDTLTTRFGTVEASYELTCKMANFRAWKEMTR